MWDTENMLLADIADSNRIIAWQKTKDGQKGRNVPKPIPRPGVEDTKSKRVKGDAIPINEFTQRLEALRSRVYATSAEEQVQRYGGKKA